MDIFSVLSFFGGIAVFLYGMHIMSESLQALASGRIEGLLSRLTSNLFKAVMLGAAVTAVIQSSSATTVMVVGLVNAGLMNLNQAVGVIMGANVGTTVTAWLLSLTGLSETSSWLKLLSPDGFAPILLVIGVIFILFSKKDRQRITGTICAGLGLLMLGMKIMGLAVGPLQSDPNFTSFFLLFQNPLLGILAGAILTAIIQSSSASVGILQALVSTGQVQWGSAIPIIMGQNIGTCVTALISSIGAKKNAKRAAIIHLLFNLFGSLLFVSIFYLVHALRPFSFLEEQVNIAGIAVFHTIFNVTATTILLPFHNALVKMSILLVPESHATEPASEETVLDQEAVALLSPLEPRFLETPAFALSKAEKVVSDMAGLAQESLATANLLLDDASQENLDRVIHHENLIDRLEDKLQTYLLHISQQSLQDEEVVRLNIMMHAINDLERISDHTVHVAEAFKKQASADHHLSKDALEEMRIFVSAVNDTVDLTVQYFNRFFADHDAPQEGAMEIEAMEEVVDTLSAELYQRHIERLKRGDCSETMGIIYQDLLAALERISDHCSNIAFYLVEIKGGAYDRHEYNQRAHQNNQSYNSQYHDLKAQYALPPALHTVAFE